MRGWPRCRSRAAARRMTRPTGTGTTEHLDGTPEWQVAHRRVSPAMAGESRCVWRLTGEFHEVRAKVAVHNVDARGVAHDPERIGNLLVVVGVAGGAVVVQVDGEPELTGVLKH